MRDDYLEIVYEKIKNLGFTPYNIYYSGDYLKGISENKNVYGCYQIPTESLLNVFENPEHYITSDKSYLYLLEIKFLISEYFNGKYFSIECLNNEGIVNESFKNLRQIINTIPFPYHSFINEFEKDLKVKVSDKGNKHPFWVINDLQILSFLESKINGKTNFKINKDYPIYDKAIDFYLKDKMMPNSLFNACYNFIQNKFNELKGICYSKKIDKITQEHYDKVNNFVLNERMKNF